MEFDGLPGADLLAQGLSDLSRREQTVSSLLVSIGAPRLRLLGFELSEPFIDAETCLYRLLSRESSDSAHGRYNALVRMLVSFERAAAVRLRAA